jgi:mRNA-degrading endonuclease RelE of RelBE toxin-antitoxin system
MQTQYSEQERVIFKVLVHSSAKCTLILISSRVTQQITEITSHYVVQQCIKYIIKHVMYLLNLVFFQTGQKWQNHKTRVTYNIQNNRPILLVYAFSKRLEQFMLIHFVSRNNILTQAQTGFRDKRSTEEE